MLQRRLVASILALLTLLASLGLAQAQGSGPFVFDLLKKPAFKSSYEAMFRNEKNVDGWMVQPTGPSSPSKTYQTDGKPGIGGMTCLQHDCGANTFFYLFTQDGSRAVGILVKGKTQRWFGNPTPAEKNTLLEVTKKS